MSEIATISALVNGKQTSVSFRHLSSLLKVPIREAQDLLSKYVSSQKSSELTILWCVTTVDEATGHTRMHLTVEPSSDDINKQIWAIGPKSISKATSPTTVWLHSDLERDRQLVKAPSYERNELRDGRWNVIKSTTSSWDDKIDPRIKDMPNGNTTNGKQKSNAPISLLAAAQARMKNKDTKKRTKTSSLTAYQKPNDDGNGRVKQAAPGSLFSSKPLGMQAAAKIKEEERKKKSKSSKPDNSPNNTTNGKKKPSSKSKSKSRRIVDEDSDNEEKAEPNLEEDEEIDEEEKRREELEKEEAEREEAERAARDEERAELAKEVAELTKEYSNEDDEEEPDDAELMREDVNQDDENSPSKRKGSTIQEPDNGKKFRETFGVKEVSPSSKRIRKEVEETVEEENGYLTTRTVVKWVDGHGNEVEGPSHIEAESKEEKKEKHESFANMFGATKQSQSQPPTKGTERRTSGVAKKGKNGDANGNSKRPNSKQSASSGAKKTSKKTGKGNIMSYFGKK